MRFVIRHEGKGRLRVHLRQTRMSCREADTLLYYLENLDEVESAKVYEKTQDAVICYKKDREAVLRALQQFHYEDCEVPENVLANSGREMNEVPLLCLFYSR